MNRILCALCAGMVVLEAAALSESLPRPQIHFPKNFDTNRAAQIESVLLDGSLKYLNGLTSYWEPHFSTTLVYGGDAEALNRLLAQLYRIEGVSVRLAFSPDLSKETGSALSPGNWWVKYSHTMPDTITIRINLAATAMEKLELQLPKQTASASKVPMPLDLDEAAVLQIARGAVSTNDSWIDRAEFENPRKRKDAPGWSVVVWRIPKTPGGFRIIHIDEKGQVTGYLRGN